MDVNPRPKKYFSFPCQKGQRFGTHATQHWKRGRGGGNAQTWRGRPRLLCGWHDWQPGIRQLSAIDKIITPPWIAYRLRAEYRKAHLVQILSDHSWKRRVALRYRTAAFASCTARKTSVPMLWAVFKGDSRRYPIEAVTYPFFANVLQRWTISPSSLVPPEKPPPWTNTNKGLDLAVSPSGR